MQNSAARRRSTARRASHSAVIGSASFSASLPHISAFGVRLDISTARRTV
ncbi:hypothetical protein ACQP0C_41970 (plasmid) [Nocardia sp. CA-129566]